MHSTASGNVLSFYAFRANSIFDPDQTGTGHQPMGHDTWQSIYNHYVVESSTIRATFTPAAQGAFPGVGGIRLDDDGAIPITALENMVEQGNSVSGTLTYAEATRPLTVYKSFNAANWFRMPYSTLNTANNVIGSVFGANPFDIASFVLFTGSYLGPYPEVNVDVLIQYQVLMSEPKNQTSS